MRTSDADDCPIKCNLEIGAKELQSDLIGKFIACIIDSNWWVGVVKEVSEGDSEVQLMQFNSGAKTFRWPTIEDICWIPSDNILAIIKVPSQISEKSRHYTISNEELKEITKKYNSWNS